MNLLRGAAHGLRSCLIGFVLLISIPVGSVYAFSHWLGVWPKLRDEAARFESMPAYSRAGRIEEGGESCLLACLTGDGAPRISLVFTVSQPPAEACRDLAEAVREIGEVAEWNPRRSAPFDRPDCRYEAALKQVGSEAYVLAAVGRGASFRGPGTLRTEGIQRGDVVSWVRIASGIGPG